MKKLTVKKNVECMACLECVRACSEAFYKELPEHGANFPFPQLDVHITK